MKKKKINFKFNNKIKILLSLFGVILFIALKMYLMFQVDLLMKDRRTLTLQLKKISGQTEKLQAEVDRLSNIDRIMRIAREKYGMINDKDETLAIQLIDSKRLNAFKEEFANKEKKAVKVNLAGVQ
jgi:cell division protein FtsL